MNLRTLVDAIGGIDSRHVEAADEVKPRRRWVTRAVAAVLAVAVGVVGFALWRSRGGNGIHGGARIPAGVAQLAKPVYPDRVRYAKETLDDFRAQWARLRLSDSERERFGPYLTKAIPAFLSGRDKENAVCSPMDIYIGLAMLAETTGGETQRQIMELLGQNDLEDLRALTNRAWNALYVDDGISNLELASSLWLSGGMTFDETVLGNISENYYASAYAGEMGSEPFNKALKDWLREHTGGLLDGVAGGVELTADTALALVSAIYFKDKWTFDEERTDQGKFHAPDGDVDVYYMHQTIENGRYYWGDKYAAYVKSMENSRMVLILPDEGYTPEELLSDPQALELLMGELDSDRSGLYEVELTLPRFDVKSDGLLNDALKSLGVTDAFDLGSADFSPLDARGEDGTPAELYVNRAIHASRVKVDEEGCEGAAYAVFEVLDGSTMPPEDQERVEITFDRPFLFAVIQEGLPIFTGVVNEP